MNQPLFFRKLLLVFVLLIPSILYSQFQEFAYSYGTLSTIAGKGEFDNGNAWSAAFENGNAVDAELTRPHFAMADRNGNIYIADKDAHGIRMVSTDGKIHTIAGTNVAGDNGDGLGIQCQLNSPNGIWVNENGVVFILDLGNNKIRKLDVSGNLETIVYDDEGISLGRGLWLSQSEDTIYYASSNRIKMWTESDGITTFSSGYSALGNITMDKNGFLVATDRSANLVYRISKDGSSNEIIAGNGLTSGGGDNSLATETGLNGVRGVWFLDDNSYFVATHQGSQIWYIDTGGIIHLFLNGRNGDEYHSGDGEKYNTEGYKISEPRSVSVDYDGNVIIVENDNGFVRKIENDYDYYYTNINNEKSVFQNTKVFPNPAKLESIVHYELDQSEQVSIVLFNNLGAKVKTIINEFQYQGIQENKINISDLPTGCYYLVMSTNRKSQTLKLFVRK